MNPLVGALGMGQIKLWTVRQGSKGCWQEITKEMDLAPPFLSCVTLNKSLPLFGPQVAYL